jgi:hypothetical protein
MMFYDRDSITKDLALIRNKISGVIRVPMPNYKNGERWTDEFRIRDGHIKLEDGTWVTEIIVEDYLGDIEKSILQLYDSYQKSLQENRVLLQQRREMEYGLRVAEKALKNSLAITKESIDE